MDICVIKGRRFSTWNAPDKVPETSHFLLEINFTELTKALLKTQHYWTLVVNATIKAQHLEANRGAHLKQIQKLVNRKRSRRKTFGVVALKQQIRANRMHTHSFRGCACDCRQLHPNHLSMCHYQTLASSQCHQHPHIQQAPQKARLSRTPRQAMCQRLHL